MKDTPALRERVFNLFPSFANAGRDVQDELFEYGSLVEIPAHQFICLEGSTCTGIPLVLDGRARVYKLSESGREITLYRVEPGNSCVLTASCIMSGVEFPAFAATETKLDAIIIPPETLQRWVSQHKVWSEYLWGLLSSRLAEVISLVEEVAFQRVDKRTAEYLLHLADADGKITKTHQDIAADLGSSREVISRILKEFEHRGLISLSRGEIHTENLIALQEAAST